VPTLVRARRCRRCAAGPSPSLADSHGRGDGKTASLAANATDSIWQHDTGRLERALESQLAGRGAVHFEKSGIKWQGTLVNIS